MVLNCITVFILKKEAILAVENMYGVAVNDDVAESILIARSAFDLPKIEC